MNKYLKILGRQLNALKVRVFQAERTDISEKIKLKAAWDVGETLWRPLRQKELREGRILEDEVSVVLWGRVVSHRAFSTIYDHWLLL